jgi:hypothetical protein
MFILFLSFTTKHLAKFIMEKNFDILISLSNYDLEHLIFQILGSLSALDLRCCQLVSSHWSYLVESLFQRHEKKLLGQG